MTSNESRSKKKEFPKMIKSVDLDQEVCKFYRNQERIKSSDLYFINKNQIELRLSGTDRV